MNKLNNLQKYQVVAFAQKLFNDNKDKIYYFGMCRYLIEAAGKLYHDIYKSEFINLKDLKYFDRDLLGADYKYPAAYWWNLDNHTPRNKAFNTLRYIYQELAKNDLSSGEIKLEKYEILEILKMARDNQENAIQTGMSLALQRAFCDKYKLSLSSKGIRKVIPIFNPEFLKLGDIDLFSYWWPIHDRKSRLKAFDKMIKYYKKK